MEKLRLNIEIMYLKPQRGPSEPGPRTGGFFTQGVRGDKPKANRLCTAIGDQGRISGETQTRKPAKGLFISMVKVKTAE